MRKGLLSTKDSVVCANEDCNVTVLSPTLKSIPHVVRLAFASANISVKMSEMLLHSERIIVNQEVFHSKSYTLVKKRNSYTVILTNGKIFAIQYYVIVNNLCYAVGRFLPIIRNFKLFSDKNALSFQVGVGKSVEPVSVNDVTEIVSKVVFLRCDHLDANIACMYTSELEIVK